MEPKSLDAGRGVAWFSSSWPLFAKQSGLWVLIAVVVIVLVLALGSTSLGGLLLTLFGPALAGGLVYGAAEIKAGRPLAFNHLWRGFSDQAKFTPLLILGAVMLGAWVVSLLIFAALVGGTFLTLMTSSDLALPGLQLTAGVLIALLLALTVNLVATALVYFAIPLVMLRGAAAGAAMQSSWRACVVNVMPLFLFSLVFLGLAIVASIPLGLGWLILLPWSVAMLYCSYDDIFPA